MIMKNFATLGKNEMKQVVGGNLMALIQQMWDATPEGGSSTWTNANDDDCWEGIVTCYNCSPRTIRAVACI
jgi:hypothetical protein